MKRWILMALILLFAGLFLTSGYFLGDYFLESYRQQQEFDRLSQLMHTPQAAPERNTSPDASQEQAPEAEPVQAEEPETGDSRQMLPEFTQLYAMNDDIVGWIQIPGTRIDYPVMQNSHYTDYYLYLDFDETYSRHGCIYVREECDVAAPSDNLTIYGHRMGDGTMFNDLHKYLDEDFCRENPTILFTTLTQRRTYKILAVFTLSSSVGSDFPYHLFVDAAEAADFDDYVSTCKAYALYDTGVTASYGDKLITLSTCEYTHENGRLVVVARQVS